MKRGTLISLATLAMLGSTILLTQSYAETVSVKGNTKVTMYGFVRTQLSWNNQTADSPDHCNMPTPKPETKTSKLEQKTYNKTYTKANSIWTRIGFKFSNDDANIKGVIEGDFAHDSNFRLRKATVARNFNNFYVLVGQDYIVEEVHQSMSQPDKTPVGFNNQILRVPQIQIGTNIDMGSAQLELSLAFEYGTKKAIKTGTDSKKANTQTMYVNRIVIPYPTAKASSSFDTGFGALANIYVFGSAIPVYLTTSDNKAEIDKPETSYSFGTGFKLPVDIVTVGANYMYTDGAEGYVGATRYAPGSYYYVNGSIEKTQTNSFNINVIIKPFKNIAFGSEFDYVYFKNDAAFNGTKPKVYTYVGNINIKTTKYTKLTLEYRHIQAEDFDCLKDIDDSDFSGDQVFLQYKYSF